MKLSSWSRPRDDMAWYGEKIVTAPIFSIGFEARHQGVVEGCFQFASNKASRGMGLKCIHEAIAKHVRIVLAGRKAIMTAETRRFDFENGRSVLSNNSCMLCGRISDTGLYSFCEWRIQNLISYKINSCQSGRVYVKLTYVYSISHSFLN